MGQKNKDSFVLFWINRNARRKRPGDLLWSFKIFLDKINKKYGKKDSILLLHTDPTDMEGPNLFAQAEALGIKDNIIFSTLPVLLFGFSSFCQLS